MLVRVRDNQHFQDMNDFIAFQRPRVKDFTWVHSIEDFGSSLEIEFHNTTDALMFKLQYG